MTAPDSVGAEEKELRDAVVSAYRILFDVLKAKQPGQRWEAIDPDSYFDTLLLTAYRDHVYAAGVAEGKASR